MSTGRSPYPTRSRRRQQAIQQQQQQQHPSSNGSMMLDASQASTSMLHLDDSFAASSISPRHSMASAASSTNSYRLGQSLVQARLSPRNTSAATSAARRRGFFDTQAAPTKPSTPAPADEIVNTNISANAIQPPAPVPRVVPAPTFVKQASDEQKDGINLTHLRRMAMACLGQHHGQASPLGMTSTSPNMAVFYASMVYAKTLTASDAMLYAQALFQNNQAKRCVRLLEQAGLFSPPSTAKGSTTDLGLRLEAALIATQALASLDEWSSVLTVLEDPHLYQAEAAKKTNFTATPGSPNPSFFPLAHPTIIEDDDDIAWHNLAESLRPTSEQPGTNDSIAVIHPLARICCWRGRAYLETGHPVRAATFYQRALQIDGYCVDALDGLLENSVISPTQALEAVQRVSFPPNQAWLRALYLARVHVVAPTTSATDDLDPLDGGNGLNMSGVDNLGKSTLGADDPFWQDASSIQLLTPINASGPGESNRRVFFGSTTVEKMSEQDKQRLKAKEDENKEVESALDTLLNTHHLEHSSQVLAMAAQRAYRQSDLPLALKYCQDLAKVDPLCLTAAYVHVSTLVALGHKRTLFQLAHEWVDAAPKSARAWFAVGSYYYACGRYHIAQRHYCRATRLAPQVVEAWIAFGTSFAACDESDQALASFRAAQRLAPGDPTSLLYIGMEYLRTNHISLAEHFLLASYRASRGTHRLCLNELGVWNLAQKKFDASISWFVQALGGSVGSGEQKGPDWKNPSTLSELLDTVSDAYWEGTLFNLAHAYRKLRHFDLAILCLERCLTLQPTNASALSALGFCHHLQGDLDTAIDTYHQALAQKPDDPFSSEMLQRALQDALSSTSAMFDAMGLNDNERQGGEASLPVARGNKRPTSMEFGRPSTGTARSAADASYLTEDGLSLSVESSSDVDMG